MKRTPAEREAFCETAARLMIANPTEAERRIWDVLGPLGFRQQIAIVGHTKNDGGWSYIMDFYHPALKLCVEVDGGVHKRQKGRDRRRDTRLAGEGILTLRLKNDEVLNYLDDAMLRVRQFMSAIRSGRWSHTSGVKR